MTAAPGTRAATSTSISSVSPNHTGATEYIIHPKSRPRRLLLQPCKSLWATPTSASTPVQLLNCQRLHLVTSVPWSWKRRRQRPTWLTYACGPRPHGGRHLTSHNLDDTAGEGITIDGLGVGLVLPQPQSHVAKSACPVL